MPVRSLTDAERGRLSGFPAELPEEDLYSYFTLSGPDRAVISARSAPTIRLGFALSLCAVRYLGFCPEDLGGAPKSVLWYVGEQVGASVEAIKDYGQREQTRTDHLRIIYEHLGYSRVDEDDLDALSEWLAERALEHDDQALLVSLAAERLRVHKLVRPALYRLERMASSAREQAVEQTFHTLSPVLSEQRVRQLDRLLVPVTAANVSDSNASAESSSQEKKIPASVAKRGLTPLSWLKDRATSNTPPAINEQLQKLFYLRELGVESLDVASVNPNRLKLLASVGRRYTNQALHRQTPQRRYPVLVAFLKESHTEITDEVVDLFDQCLAEADRRARNELAEFRRNVAKASDEKVRLFKSIGGLLLDPEIRDEELREKAFALAGSKEELRAALDDSERLLRPVDDNYYDFFDKKYAYVRKFAPKVLASLNFRSNKTDDPLLDAVSLLKELDASSNPSGNGAGTRTANRKVPHWAPLEFVPDGWLPYIAMKGPDGKLEIDRSQWELCLLWELRSALRSGDVWVEGARRYADPQSFLIPRERWPSLKQEVRLLTGVQTDGAEHLSACRAEMESTMSRLQITVSRGGKVQVQEGKLLFGRDDADELPESVKALGKEVVKRLPKVELTDLIVEVDRWSGFLRQLTHAGGSEPRSPELQVHLYAAILAQATNIGPKRMADLADLSYAKLAWCYTWYLREDTLKAAIASIVNFHHGLPLSNYWGGGTLSSSDGQRFPMKVKSKNARSIPRYYGYGKGITHYSWTSDQFSLYGAKVIPSTVRDATYVLDGILGNESELAISEHTVDTSGFTETVFALFGMLGLRFSPRIKDVSEQRLYRMLPAGSKSSGSGSSSSESVLEDHLARSLLAGKIKEKLILKHWDDIQRVAGSLKLGWVPASLMVSRLEARPRKSSLARAIQEYGRLQKTLFLLRYAESRDLRKRIGRQLNKGEDLHALRNFLFFAGEGKIQKRDPEEQGDQALCLNLLTDAAIAWNTVYYQKVLDQLSRKGYPINDEDLAHLWPTRNAHINPYGKYTIDADVELPEDEDGLRLLRQS